MDGRAPRRTVFSIPASAPFLQTLADALLAGRFGVVASDDPLVLASATVLLPTRRAVRAFRDILLERLGGRAAILPQIRPIGDVDEDEHLLSLAAGTPADRIAVPEAIGSLARQLELTRLVLLWREKVLRDRSLLRLGENEPLLVPASVADATHLAADLARLIDDMETAGIPWDEVARIAPDDHAAYFQMTLEFLKIAFEFWPARLAELGRADPAARRDRLIRAEAARLLAGPPEGPVVAAGSTGSIPATAALLSAIAALPNGAVVLPGLDLGLDEAGWQAIGTSADAEAAHGHPQYGLKQLIAAIGILRSDVVVLGEAAPAAALRERLVSEALRPAETTEAWAPGGAVIRDPATLAGALAGVGLLVARNEQEEALAIALAIRKALADGSRSVALVTPDRTIACRVAAELGRFAIAVDDSAGVPLDGLPPAVFARHLLEAADGDGDPVRLLSLLKHPFASFGLGRARCRAAARILERAVLRGHRVTGGVAALRPALARARKESEAGAARHPPAARRGLTPADWDLAAGLVAALEAALLPLERILAGREPLPVAVVTGAVIRALEAAAAAPEGEGAPLWSGRDGEALGGLLAGLAAPDGGDIALAPGDYPGLFAALLGQVSVTPDIGGDPRVHIWGTLEARLQSVDLLILAGLDEGVFPPLVRTDAFLSRAMRAAVGLAPPERRIGLAAHDFAAALAAPDVIVTRAEKRGGAPTVESRWLQRLAAVTGDEARQALVARGHEFVALAAILDRDPAGRVAPVARPAPKPPVALRPRSLSVTEIETLVRDPYAVYARHVLKLDAFDPLGVAPDYALRGTLIHEALGRFAATWSGPFDAAAEAALLTIGDEVLSAIDDFPEIRAVWALRFRAVTRWYVGWEAARAGEIAARHAETGGRLDLAAPAGTFRLRGVADRIDLRKDGAVEIYDFKTGTPPSARQVLTGFAPQLALEAMMAKDGAFAAVGKGRSVAALAWIALARPDRGDPVRSAVESGYTPDAVADKARGEFLALVGAFDDPERPYLSRARPQFETRYESDYDHLARVREWGLAGGEGEGG
jgi:ATP-dependent helicase/nuclease subunit B